MMPHSIITIMSTCIFSQSAIHACAMCLFILRLPSLFQLLPGNYFKFHIFLFCSAMMVTLSAYVKRVPNEALCAE